MMRTLAQAGVQPMAALKPGDRFDPSLQQAVASLAAEGFAPGTIIDVVRTGYSFDAVVLRPAQVIVAAAAQTSASGEGN